MYMWSGHYTTSINCCKKNILLQWQQNMRGLKWLIPKTPLLQMQQYLLLVDYVMVFVLEQEDWRAITLKALSVQHLYPIRSRSKNKRWNLWVGWCASSWRPRFWSVHSINYLYTYHVSYLRSKKFKYKLFRRDIYLPIVGVVMPVCWMIWYCYSYLPAFKYIFQLYSSGFSLSWYGYRRAATLCIGQLRPITDPGLFFGCVLFWCWVPLCFLLLVPWLSSTSSW